MNKKRAVWVLTVAGISLAAPYTLAVLAQRFPSSPLARLNTTIHAKEA